jgi:hypothetical protein
MKEEMIPLPSKVVKTSKEYLEKAIFILETVRDCLDYVDVTYSVTPIDGPIYAPWADEINHQIEVACEMANYADRLLDQAKSGNI